MIFIACVFGLILGIVIGFFGFSLISYLYTPKMAFRYVCNGSNSVTFVFDISADPSKLINAKRVILRNGGEVEGSNELYKHPLLTSYESQRIALLERLRELYILEDSYQGRMKDELLIEIETAESELRAVDEAIKNFSVRR